MKFLVDERGFYGIGFPCLEIIKFKWKEKKISLTLMEKSSNEEFVVLRRRRVIRVKDDDNLNDDISEIIEAILFSDVQSLLDYLNTVPRSAIYRVTVLSGKINDKFMNEKKE